MELFLCVFLCCNYYVLKQVPFCFSCSGEYCNAVLLWSSRNAVWTRKRHPSFLRNECEKIMTECLFWVTVSFKASGRMLWYIVVKHNKGMPSAVKSRVSNFTDSCIVYSPYLHWCACLELHWEMQCFLYSWLLESSLAYRRDSVM